MSRTLVPRGANRSAPHRIPSIFKEPFYATPAGSRGDRRVASLSLAAESVQAQGRARGGLRMGNVAAVQLLLVDEVQTELKLTDEQKKSAATCTKST